MNAYDVELYYHPRLPKPDNGDGPTAGLMRLEAARMLWALAAEQLELDVDQVVA
jgi:hypothetical protein